MRVRGQRFSGVLTQVRRTITFVGGERCDRLDSLLFHNFPGVHLPVEQLHYCKGYEQYGVGGGGGTRSEWAGGDCTREQETVRSCG